MFAFSPLQKKNAPNKTDQKRDPICNNKKTTKNPKQSLVVIGYNRMRRVWLSNSLHCELNKNVETNQKKFQIFQKKIASGLLIFSAIFILLAEAGKI